MDIISLTPVEATKAIELSEDIVEVKQAADALGVSYSGNSGIKNLKVKVIEAIGEQPKQPELDLVEEVNEMDKTLEESIPEKDEDDDDDISDIQITPPLMKKPGLSIEELLKMDPNKEESPIIRRKIIRAKGLRLHKVKITNIDPNDTEITGVMVTVYNKYLGKVSRNIPFGEAMEDGWHIEEVLLNVLKGKQYPLRKLIRNNKGGAKQYKTVMTPKYSIVMLDELGEEGLEDLAKSQLSRSAIDK